MQFENVYVPYGAYWSTPFSKWQGSFSTLPPIPFAAEVGAGVLADRGIAPDVFDALCLGWTIPSRHAFFGALVEGRQDDGESPLLEAYRYIDSRLAELHAAMDRDDLLIVLSDHGIRTAMEHEEDAIFVAIGEGVPRGRASGMPRLDGVPRVLAQLMGVKMGVEMGVERNWPDSGLAPWAEHDGSRLELVQSP